MNNTTLIYYDGSFVKLRNINLGYSFSNAIASKLRMESLRVFTSIQQPKIWAKYISKYNGVDPEVSITNDSGGSSLGNNIGGGVTPATKVITIGLNAKF